MKCSDLLKQVNKRSFTVPSQRYSQVLSRHWCFHYISHASVIFWNLTGPGMVEKVRNMLWFTSACEGRLWFVPQGLQCQSYLPAQLLLSSFLTCLSPDKTSYQKFPVSMVSACQIDFLCPRCTCACQPAGSACHRESGTLLGNKSAHCQGILITKGAAWQASDPFFFI